MIKIAIFGVGLIGGSLGLCFKNQPNITVVGHSNNLASVEKYMEHEVVDEATTSMEMAVFGADFIFLCVPVGQLPVYLNKLNQLPLKQGCIITDVGSTKTGIMTFAEQLSLKDAHFIGGHPMAGSERSGVEAASSILFENAFYVLTPLSNVNEAAYQRLASLLSLTRAQLIRMNHEEHDTIVGAISHLPHIIAVTLVNQVREYNQKNALYASLAAGGFRDITRIASSDSFIWRDILLSNKNVLLNLLQDWNKEIATLITCLENNDGDAIARLFATAAQFRDSLPKRRKGVIAPVFDLYAEIPDVPGVIGKVTTLLGDKGIDVSNIQIMESRLDIPGVLRLSFRTQVDVDAACKWLRTIGIHGYC